MNRIFIDLDGVIVDFESYRAASGLTGDELKKQPGVYLMMQPIAGAIEAVHSLIGMGWDVWVATKPPTGIPYAYADKVTWVLDHLPELKRKIILTHDKGLLGDEKDYLIDDRPHKANASEFSGELLVFGKNQWGEVLGWPEILEFFRKEAKCRFPQKSS